MRNIVLKLVLILGLVAAFFLLIWPPEEKIRLGKDLRGGVSLTYVVRLPEGETNPAAVLEQVITVLKNRVNPQGVLDISFEPQGRDRIEIVMPAPSDEVRQLKEAYEDELEKLIGQSTIHRRDLEQALAEGTALQVLGDSGDRGNLVKQLQLTHDARKQAAQMLADAQAAGKPAAELRPFEQAVADTDIRFEELRDELLRMSLDERRVRAMLAQPNTPTFDAATNLPIEGSSPRDQALRSLSIEYPHLAAALSELVAAHDRYTAKRTGFDDPEDLIRLLRGAGVLEFQIAVRTGDTTGGINIADLRQQLQERGPDNVDSAIAGWFPINDLKQWYDEKEPAELADLQANPAAYFARSGFVAEGRDGRYYMLLYISEAKSITHDRGVEWGLEGAFRTNDDLGRDAVGFRLDQAGGALMGRMTGAHVGLPMAIVLDGQVYSAPILQSRIGGNGVIQGRFTASDIEYLIRVLASGALKARLSPEPISISNIGPSLGKDNLLRGAKACLLSIIITAAIMLVYYFFAGFIAVLALLINALFTFGLMAFIDGTFTLPGLAGVALSISMAVDANVLIYERIREEIVNNGEDLRTAIRLGYQRALRAIIDGNMTHLIVCVVLLYTATTEVKGFALTMIMGTIATLFTAIFVTRVLYALYTDVFKLRSLPMLPMVFPAIHRALQPSVDWIRLRPVFLTISAIAVIGSLTLVFSRGKEMLDTEFRGGISATMTTRMAHEGEPKPADSAEEPRLLLSRAAVEQAVHAIGDQAAPDDAVRRQLSNASVLTVGKSQLDAAGNVLATSFQIKVASPPGSGEEATITETVVTAIAAAFGDQLDIDPPLAFTGADDQRHESHVHKIERDRLGQNIGRPQSSEDVREFLGGVAIVIDGIKPAVTVEEAEQRLERMRHQPDFTDAAGREDRVVGLDLDDPANPAAGYRSVAVLVSDALLDSRRVDIEVWDRELAAREWQLVSTAFARGSSLQQVSSFSPAVAETLAANAVVAVVLSLLGMLIYIWVRFGSLRYSLATVVALAHNVALCLGALAITHLVAGSRFASFLLLDEYRIDLNVIAALLTIIGYSINDTIVILDRIRENRGKRPLASPEIVNRSINQTFSRTILTGGSTILASIILYALGGTGIQPFAFTFLIGLLVGTYSSVVIAAPLVVKRPPPTGEGVLESSTELARMADDVEWRKDQAAAGLA